MGGLSLSAVYHYIKKGEKKKGKYTHKLQENASSSSTMVDHMVAYVRVRAQIARKQGPRCFLPMEHANRQACVSKTQQDRWLLHGCYSYI